MTKKEFYKKWQSKCIDLGTIPAKQEFWADIIALIQQAKEETVKDMYERDLTHELSN